MVVLIIFAGISGLDSNVLRQQKLMVNERQTIFKYPTINVTNYLNGSNFRLVDSLKTFDQIYSTLGGQDILQRI